MIDDNFFRLIQNFQAMLSGYKNLKKLGLKTPISLKAKKGLLESSTYKKH